MSTKNEKQSEAVATLRKYGETRVADALDARLELAAWVALRAKMVRKAQAKYWGGDKSKSQIAAMKLAEKALDDSLAAWAKA